MPDSIALPIPNRKATGWFLLMPKLAAKSAVTFKTINEQHGFPPDFFRA